MGRTLNHFGGNLQWQVSPKPTLLTAIHFIRASLGKKECFCFYTHLVAFVQNFSLKTQSQKSLLLFVSRRLGLDAITEVYAWMLAGEMT
jgi:hypothetical protein